MVVDSDIVQIIGSASAKGTKIDVLFLLDSAMSATYYLILVAVLTAWYPCEGPQEP